MWKRLLTFSCIFLSCLPGAVLNTAPRQGTVHFINSRSVTGSKIQPFKLSHGDRLDIQVGDMPVQSIVFRKTVRLKVGDNFQDVIDSNPAGTLYIISGGTYRCQSVIPKTGDMFIGEPGAVMSGAKILSGCALVGSLWAYTLTDTLHPTRNGECTGNYEKLPNESGVEASIRLCLPCVYPEMLFVTDLDNNQTILTRVSSLDQVSEGKWYLDYNIPQRVIVSKNYTGYVVELSVTPYAFGYSDPNNKASDVTIKNLVIEKYANPAQTGAIGGFRPGSGWIIEDNEVRLNHGGGIKFNGNAIVRGNKVHHNGQIGIIAGDGNSEQRFGGDLPEWGFDNGNGGTGGLVEGNTIANNGLPEVGFNPGWEAGGTKFAQCKDLTVRNNRVYNNGGIGLWSDFSNSGTTYENNLIEDNQWEGISIEITQGPTIVRYNTLKNNGKYITHPDIYGSQIIISNSPDVEVYDNRLVTARDYGNGITIRNAIRDVNGTPIEAIGSHVHNNVIVIKSQGAENIGITGGQAEMNLPLFYLVRNNKFRANVYHVADCNGKYWRWDSQPFHEFPPFLTWNQWKAMNQDSLGKMNSDTGASISFSSGKGYTAYIRPSYTSIPVINDLSIATAQEIVKMLNSPYFGMKNVSASVYNGKVKIVSWKGIKVTGGTAKPILGF